MSGRAAQFSVDLRPQAQRRHLATALFCFSVISTINLFPLSHPLFQPGAQTSYVKNDKEPLMQGENKLKVSHLSFPCVYSDPS